MKLRKFKKSLLLAAAVSVFGVLACAISTFTWFQVNEKATPSINSGSPNLSISSVATTKNLLQKSPDGSTNYDGLSLYEHVTTPTSESGQSSENTTFDTDFNIPKNGVGYYMVKRNASNNYIYGDATVANSGTYKLTTFTDVSGNDKSNKAYLESVNLYEGEMYRFFDYTFKSENDETKTVNERVKVNGVTSPNDHISIDSYDLEIETTGNYKLWLDYKTGQVGVEYLGSIVNPNNLSMPINNNLINSPKKTITPDSNTCYIVVRGDFWTDISNIGFYIWKDGGSSKTTWDASWNNSTATGDGTYYIALSNSDITTRYNRLILRFKQYTSNTYQSTDTTISLAKGRVIYINSVTYKEAGKVDITVNNSTYSLPSGSKVYYVYDPNHVFSDGGNTNRPKIHTWADSGNIWPFNYQGFAFPGFQATYVAENLYEFTIPTSYDRMIIAKYNYSDNNQVKTDNLTIPTSTSSGANNAYKVTKCSTGSWYYIGSAGSNNKYYFYDPLEFMGTQPYVHYWRSTNEYYGVSGTSTSNLTAMTSEATTLPGLWSVTISSRFDNMLIANKQNLGDSGKLQTTDITSLTSYAGKCFWLKTTNGNVGGKTGGKFDWQAATSYPAKATRTYKLFDNKGSLSLNSSTDRYAYVWKDGSGDSSLAHWQLNSWPGIKMEKSTTEANVWYVTVSTTYDRIIFNNGGPNTNGSQTANLTIGSTGSTSVGTDGWYFVLSSTTISSGDDAGKWDGQWYQNAHNVGIYAAFVLDDGSPSNVEAEQVFNDTAFGLAPYYPADSVYSGLSSDLYRKSSTNAAFYHFTLDDGDSGNTKFFSDAACTTPYVEGATATDGSSVIFVRYVATLSSHKTIYVDISDSGGLGWGWPSLTVADSGHNTILNTTDTSNGLVSNKLYKITLPNDYKFYLSGNVSYSQDNYGWTGQLDMADAVTNSCDFLLITANDTGNSVATWCKDKVESTDKAYVCVKDNEGNIENYRMGVGNNQPNLWIYEKGVVLEQGYQVWFKIGDKDAKEDSDYTYYKYENYGNPDTSSFQADAEDGNIEAKFQGQKRYTFYVYVYNNQTLVSLAEVPLLGNGYYIMQTENASSHSGFSGAKKMSSGTNGGASYGGYEVTSGTMIYIRSYIDAQDTYYKNVDTTHLPSGVEAIMDGGKTTGVIRFTANNTFNINISADDVITITEFTINDDFYKLNELDINVSNQQQIFDQNTSMVVEIQFTANNPEPMSIDLELTNGLTNYVGVSLYVTDQKMRNYYNFMRDNCYFDENDSCLLSNGSHITNQNTGFTTTAHSGSNVYYAYILIDYMYSSTNTKTLQYQNGATLTSFKLIATQV